MPLLIKGGDVIDPGNIKGIMDILITDNRIDIVAPHPSPELEKKASQIIDAAGKIVTPGLIDMHVHFREPGFEHKETIETGCRAAAAGGFTAVCTMPNTRPACDSAMVVDYILGKAKAANGVKVYPVAAISRGLEGKSLCNFDELKQAGAVAVSDDGMPVIDNLLMRCALESAGDTGLLVISHSEAPDLAGNGVMNECGLSFKMGLPGIPNAAESIMVMREIALAELTGVPVHIAHVSAKESVQTIREAKSRGVRVTAETAPHYFTLTHDAVKGYNTNAKMNPPLRSEADRLAIIQGLKDGTIDAIATDHAPHSTMEKNVEFELAPNGIIGLETSLSLGIQLVRAGGLTLPELIEKMSTTPARILRRENAIKPGNSADITLIDPKKKFTVDAAALNSKSRNTPFDRWEMEGRAVCTIVEGKIVYQDDELSIK